MEERAPSRRSVADARRQQKLEGALSVRFGGGSALLDKSSRRVSKKHFYLLVWGNTVRSGTASQRQRNPTTGCDFQIYYC